MIARRSVLLIAFLVSACQGGDSGSSGGASSTGGSSGGAATGGAATGGHTSGGATGGASTGGATGGTTGGTTGGGTGGPIDGTWTQSDYTCDGDSVGGADIVLTISGSSATERLAVDVDCVVTFTQTMSYPGSQMVTVTATASQCDTDVGCTALFGECPSPPEPTTYAYAVTSNSLTLTQTAMGDPSDECFTGEVAIATYTK